MEYTHWVEEQKKQNGGLRTALQKHISDVELHMLVENALSHYENLFRMKATVAKSDVFYLMSGMWKTATERFFLWIGGFRPSELLKVRVSFLFFLNMYCYHCSINHSVLNLCSFRF